MIKLEKTQVVGWEPAIRGMRNPMNSWEKSDTEFYEEEDCWSIGGYRTKSTYSLGSGMKLGPNDHDLMMKLASNGPVHAKYRRMIEVYVDITAPLYWWKEFDTYKVGTVANSCSTMHKIQAKPFELTDFSFEHLLCMDANDNAMLRAQIEDKNYECGYAYPTDILQCTIMMLNQCRTAFNVIARRLKEDTTLPPDERKDLKAMQKSYWWQMIQLLPSSYNQKRTVMLSYEVLAHIYPDRKNHKLDEWHEFCRWIEQLPYSELIIGEKD